MPRALIGTAAFLLLWGAAVAEDGPGVDYSRIQALKASDGPGMARFVRRCVVEGDSLDLALSDCPWSQRPAWRAAATNELVALARAAAPKHRAAALTLLAGVHRWNDDPPDAVLKAFVAGLGHDDSGVRATAALRIRFLGSAAVRGLSQRLLRIADNMKRWSWEQLKLAESLAAHGVTESAPLLLGLLKHSTPDFHRRMAIESLGLLGRRIEASIRKPLLEALRGDPSFAVRREAARALAWLGRPKDVEVLLATARAPGAGALSWIVPLDLAAVSPEVGLPLSKILPGLDHADGNVRSSTLTLLSTRRVMDPSAAHGYGGGKRCCRFTCERATDFPASVHAQASPGAPRLRTPYTPAAAVRRHVAFYVEQHNTAIPHSAFEGQTPDEMYFGRGDGVPDRLSEARSVARERRMEEDRARQCAVSA